MTQPTPALSPCSPVTSEPVPPPVSEKPAPRSVREIPAALPVASPIPVVVACETPPPDVLPLAAHLPEPVVPLALASRERTLPLKLPLRPPSSELEQLTSPETVVARRARGIVKPPPPPSARGRSENTPRMGSVDVAVIGVPAAPITQLAESPADATERVPAVSESNEEDSLQALASWPVANARPAFDESEAEAVPSRRLPSVEPRSAPVASTEPGPVAVPSVEPVALDEQLSAPLPRFDLDSEITPDLPTAEPPAVRDSAAVETVHVANSDEHAPQATEDEQLTRQLPSAPQKLPVEPIRHILAPQSDVRELLSDFKVQEGLSETELRRELKALAGVDLTPGTGLDVGPR
jgi:hypothetical protein